MFGHGTFIYHPDYTINKHGSAKKAARSLKKLGMDHAWIRGHNKNGLWKVNSNKKLLKAFRDEGISVGVWGWCDGNDIGRDTENVKASVREFQPDCYIADIENGVSGARWDKSKAKDFGQDVRGFLGDIPLVVSSFGYISWHEPEIMTALDSYADYFAPQVYWFWYPNQRMLNQTPLPNLRLKNPADYARACIYHWQQAVTKPLVVTGQAYWGESPSWTQTRAEEKLSDFLAEFDEFDALAGFNWWNFSAEQAMSPTMSDLIEEADIGGAMSGQDGASDAGFVSGHSTREPNRASQTSIWWIAAEGLKFRSSPDNTSDSNVLEELDYGARARVSGNPTSNGYVKSIVALDGTDTEGFLFERYLRPNETQMIERCVQEAVGEWHRFEKGNGVEYLEPYSSYIGEMWTARGYPDLTGKDRDWFWSAAYISWILENAGYEDTAFDIRHSTYIHEAIQNRVLGREGDFWAYRLDEAKPQVGDILCQWRGAEMTYDEAETNSRFSSHTDIVIAARDRSVVTLGGNVANASSDGLGVSVETKSFRREADGYLVNERRLFAIMKNRHRPLAEQEF